MGHSAKFCAYTMFCCNVPMIIHFGIVQVYHTGNMGTLVSKKEYLFTL